MSERSTRDESEVPGQAYAHLPEPVAVEDMSTSHSADPPPPLPDSDYDRQERFLRDAAG